MSDFRVRCDACDGRVRVLLRHLDAGRAVLACSRCWGETARLRNAKRPQRRSRRPWRWRSAWNAHLRSFNPREVSSGN
jgi:hypothetical protein